MPVCYGVAYSHGKEYGCAAERGRYYDVGDAEPTRCPVVYYQARDDGEGGRESAKRHTDPS